MTIQDLLVWVEGKRHQGELWRERLWEVRDGLTKAEDLLRNLPLDGEAVEKAVRLLFDHWEQCAFVDEILPPTTSVTLGQAPGWLVMVKVPELDKPLQVWIGPPDRTDRDQPPAGGGAGTE